MIEILKQRVIKIAEKLYPRDKQDNMTDEINSAKRKIFEKGVEFARPVSNKIVCLCGSTKFIEKFHELNTIETLKDNIVLSVGVNTKEDSQVFKTQSFGSQNETKKKLDELHLRKIDLCDEVIVINVNGYIGESTRKEIEYANNTGKPITYLENSNNPVMYRQEENGAISLTINNVKKILTYKELEKDENLPTWDKIPNFDVNKYDEYYSNPEQYYE